ncbi:hypothetical protein HDU96_004872 [Phlyctochytrium bullatum]|nr:hypothetical protein HDU96_004872 [Phlyctochytrium bullatum]
MLQDPEIQFYVAGTSNSVIVQNFSTGYELLADVDTGNIEIKNPALVPILNLTSPDRVFIEAVVSRFQSDTVKSPTDAGMPSDEEDWNRQEALDQTFKDFEVYLLSLMNSLNRKPSAEPEHPVPGQPSEKPEPIIEDFNENWIQSVVSSRLVEMRKTIAPIQQNLSQNLGKALSSAESTISNAISTVSNPSTHQYIQSTASNIFSSVSSWYTERKKDLGTLITNAQGAKSTNGDRSGPGSPVNGAPPIHPPRVSSLEEDEDGFVNIKSSDPYSREDNARAVKTAPEPAQPPPSDGA